MSSTVIHGCGVVNSNINIIFRNGESIVMCQTIDYKELGINNIEELEKYLNNNLPLDSIHFKIDRIKLEKDYLSNIIAKYSKDYNNEHIEWDYVYEKLSFYKMNKIVNWTPITLEVYNQPGGMGSSVGEIKQYIDIIQYFMFVFNIIKKGIDIVRTYISTYKFFEKRYRIEKSFIHSVIKKEPEWDKGFIDKNDYYNKKIYEKRIMRDCHYKFDRKNKVWRKKHKNEQ